MNDESPRDALPDGAPDWPLPDLLAAADAHWSDPARLRLLLRDLLHRSEPEARALRTRVLHRLRDLPDGAAPRVIRRGPTHLRAATPPPPRTPTPEMATLLRELQAARASGDDARKEAAALRQRLAVPPDDETVTLRRELEAARRDAQAAREEARRLAERLAFATASPARRAEPPPRPAPAPRADPAYLELGLSPDLPDELLPVLERAYLRHHHPDRAPPDQREAATVRFQAVTLAFGRIRRLRGMAG